MAIDDELERRCRRVDRGAAGRLRGPTEGDARERYLRLAERIRDGDMSALAAVYDELAPAMYRQALAVLGEPADAEDALQEVFLKLARRDGRSVRDLRAYLLTASRHEAFSLLRRRRRERPGDESDMALDRESIAATDGGSIVTLDRGSTATPVRGSVVDPGIGDEAEAIRGALDDLPSEQREVVVLKVYEELSFREIADRVRAPLATVASRYRYAMGKLREALGGAAHGR